MTTDVFVKCFSMLCLWEFNVGSWIPRPRMELEQWEFIRRATVVINFVFAVSVDCIKHLSCPTPPDCFCDEYSCYVSKSFLYVMFVGFLCWTVWEWNWSSGLGLHETQNSVLLLINFSVRWWFDYLRAYSRNSIGALLLLSTIPYFLLFLIARNTWALILLTAGLTLWIIVLMTTDILFPKTFPPCYVGEFSMLGTEFSRLGLSLDQWPGVAWNSRFYLFFKSLFIFW